MRGVAGRGACVAGLGSSAEEGESDDSGPQDPMREKGAEPPRLGWGPAR